MPEDVRKAIEDTCLVQYQKVSSELKKTNEEFYKQKLKIDQINYAEILRLINNGIFEFPTDESTDSEMKKIQLLNGYLIIPNDWVIVNIEKAHTCNYAAVLECRNFTQLNIPHFIYLFEDSNQYPDHIKDDFYNLCLKHCPNLSKISEYDYGIFYIEEKENFLLDPPYGAMIIRD